MTMPDEQEQPPEITPLAFTQHLVLVVEQPWPERTSFMPTLLQNPHVYHATYDEAAKTVEFSVFNGGARYHLTGETEAGGALVAELVPDSAKRTSRRP
jgi:hypothetical protein